MKTIKILPKVNNIDFCGRVLSKPFFSKNGNVCRFELIRNFGGGKAPVIMSFVMFKPKAGFPDFLKKGSPIIAHAYVNPVAYEGKDGEMVDEVQKVIKTIELAQLVEKQVEDNDTEAQAEAETDESAVEINED